MIGVGTDLDVEDNETKDEMKTAHKVTAMKRIMNRKENTATRTVQLCLTDYDAYEGLAKSGRIEIGYQRFKIRPWNFRSSTNQCFKCCGFSHSQNSCKAAVRKCLRCSEDHDYKTCTVTDPEKYKCANCGGKHAAVSKDCTKLKEHMEKRQATLLSNKPNQNQRTINHPPSGYHRVWSTESRPVPPQANATLHKNYPQLPPWQTNQPPQNLQLAPSTAPIQGSSCGVDSTSTGTLILFLTEILSDIVELTTDLEKNQGETFLATISKYFGNQYSSSITPKIREILRARAETNDMEQSSISTLDEYV